MFKFDNDEPFQLAELESGADFHLALLSSIVFQKDGKRFELYIEQKDEK